MKKILINLVSRQTMQNIIPALYIKPDKVILITTKEESKSAENIKKVLEKNKIYTVISDDIINAYNVNTTIEASENIISQNKDAELILNFTGGTKLMSIPAYEVFRSNNCKLIYCDSEHQRILWFENEIREEKYNVNISIKDYLNAHGYKPYKEKNRRYEVDEILMKFIDNHYSEFQSMSSYFKIAKEILKKEKTIISGNFNVNLSTKYLTLDYNNEEIFKTEPNNMNYLIGGWLEDYVYYKINLLKPDELFKNYYILSSGGSENEIDIIYTNNGNLNLISCKNLKSMDKKELFEHEGLRSLTGGTFSKGFVVVNEKSETNIRRAADLRLNLLNVAEINEGKFTL